MTSLLPKRSAASAPPPDLRATADGGWLAGIGICLAAVAAYFPALGGGFIWDDDAHVTKPALRSLSGLGRIWSEFGATQQYYPVLHSAFWVEHHLWGDTAWCYHALNISLHAAAACLLAAILRRLAVPGARLAALLFALHPVEVESVAWISEQKNTLSIVFYLSAALIYLRWRGDEVGPGGPPGRSPGGPLTSTERTSARPYLYILATLLFVLALLSKSVTATLPAALLVVLWWRHGSLSWKRDIAPLLPWFALGAAVGFLTSWVERRFIGAAGAAFDLGPLQRCLLAGRAVWFYLGKLAWPTRLVFIYPRWRLDATAGWQYLFPLGAIGLTVILWVCRRRVRGPLAAWLFFIGSLFPALGFVNVYPFIFSYVADHFQYLASLGPITLAAAVAVRAGERLSRGWKACAGIAGTAVLVACGLQTARQCRVYRDARTLYETTLALNPDCWLAHLNLGNMLLETGDVAGAVDHYRTALRLEPDYPSTHFNLGKVLLEEKRLPEAIEQFRWALRLGPGDAEAHNNLGVALAGLGRWSEAQAEFASALRLRPDYPVAQANLTRVEALQAAPPSP